jgi:hypothetical protein
MMWGWGYGGYGSWLGWLGPLFMFLVWAAIITGRRNTRRSAEI